MNTCVCDYNKDISNDINDDDDDDNNNNNNIIIRNLLEHILHVLV